MKFQILIFKKNRELLQKTLQLRYEEDKIIIVGKNRPEIQLNPKKLIDIKIPILNLISYEYHLDLFFKKIIEILDDLNNFWEDLNQNDSGKL